MLLVRRCMQVIHQMFQQAIFVTFCQGQPESHKIGFIVYNSNCFDFLQKDTSSLKMSFVRGKHSTILEIQMDTDKNNLQQINGNMAMDSEIHAGWLYYHSGSKSRKIPIHTFHQLPAKTQ
ncbi:MAG: hypothetical protein IPP71_17945 [Bacteroidetes bacterium]|nr:hypothetical protein [Bacteroidota bacterium]